MKSKRVMVIDAFCDKPFQGNPCAVLPDARELSDEEMLLIAKEMNLSETSFVLPSEKASFRVRYFTPRGELPFAGHPTIATSLMLAQENMIQITGNTTAISLEFNIGVLPVEISSQNGKPNQAVMQLTAPVFGKTVSREKIAQCFKDIDPDDIRPDCPCQVVGTGTNFLIIPLMTSSKLSNITMNRDNLMAIVDEVGVSAAYVFTKGGFSRETELSGRLCDPRNAFEDPYTGSAVGAVGAYVIHYGLLTGDQIQVEQGHFIGRPGVGRLFIEHDGKEIQSIKLGGSGVKVTDGFIFLEN